MSPLLAQSGHRDAAPQCPLLGVKRTSPKLEEQKGPPVKAALIVNRYLMRRDLD
jgi:hypothetical protein